MKRSSLKRGAAALKRKTGLARKTALRADPAKTREWEQRSRTELISKHARRRKIPVSIRKEVYRRSDGWCIMCLHLAGASPRTHTATELRSLGVRRCRELHHVLPVRFFEYLWKIASNMVGVCTDCHANHERGARDVHRIPLAALPECCGLLAEVEGGEPLVYFKRTYR